MTELTLVSPHVSCNRGWYQKGGSVFPHQHVHLTTTLGSIYREIGKNQTECSCEVIKNNKNQWNQSSVRPVAVHHIRADDEQTRSQRWSKETLKALLLTESSDWIIFFEMRMEGVVNEQFLSTIATHSPALWHLTVASPLRHLLLALHPGIQPTAHRRFTCQITCQNAKRTPGKQPTHFRTLLSCQRPPWILVRLMEIKDSDIGTLLTGLTPITTFGWEIKNSVDQNQKIEYAAEGSFASRYRTTLTTFIALK